MRNIVLTLAVLAACAPAQQQGGGGPTPVRDVVGVEVEGARAVVDIYTTNPTSSQTVPIPLERAWRALPLAFESLGLTVTTLDQASRKVGGERLRARGTFGGERFSRLLNCGETAGLPNADRYDVTLTIVTSLEEAANGTVVSTDVQAVATPNTTAGAQVRCTANRRIGEIVAKRVSEAAVQ